MHREFQISNFKFEIINVSVPPPRPLCLCGEINLPDSQGPPPTHAAPLLTKIFFTALLLLLASLATNAQDSSASKAGDALVVDGSYASDVFGLGRDVRVRGDVQHGVIAFGGDVIVEGRVEGDAASVGGSVIQLDGSYVGGDVMVFGGSYRQGGGALATAHASARRQALRVGRAPARRGLLGRAARAAIRLAAARRRPRRPQPRPLAHHALPNQLASRLTPRQMMNAAV